MSDLGARITAYLSGGGVFNPELANHDAVRDLIIDCRKELAAMSELYAKEGHAKMVLMEEISAAQAAIAEKGREIKELKIDVEAAYKWYEAEQSARCAVQAEAFAAFGNNGMLLTWGRQADELRQRAEKAEAELAELRSRVRDNQVREK